MKPSFFVVGHSKSGTTALASFLDQHPALFMCKPKEPNYFCPEFCRIMPGSTGAGRSAFVPRSQEEYLKLFDSATPDQRCGEASAAYLYAESSASRIHDFDSNARIIMIFREPVTFLHSYHLQLLKNPVTEGDVEGDLGRAIALEPERRRGLSIPIGCLIPEMLHYTTDRLAYDVHYDRFATRFAPEQVLPLVYDDFRSNNIATMRRVFEFLGVEPSFVPQIGEHNTGGDRVRSHRLQVFMHRLTEGEGSLAPLKSALTTFVPARLRSDATEAVYRRAVFEPAPAVNEDVAAIIRQRARPHVAALGARLGRDLLAEWGIEPVPESG